MKNKLMNNNSVVQFGNKEEPAMRVMLFFIFDHLLSKHIDEIYTLPILLTNLLYQLFS
jgi:hypothetical protein